MLLSTLEFDLLVALAEAPGRVFSRRQLLEHVWGYDFFGDERVVDVHIRSLRARLGDDASDPLLSARSAASATSSSPTADMTTRSRDRLPSLLASYVLVIAVGAATVFLIVRLLAPPLFDHHHRDAGSGGMGMGMGGTGRAGAHCRAVMSAVDTALLVAVLASVAAGRARRRLRHPPPAAPARRGAGRHPPASPPATTTRAIPLPREPELGALAGDVNRLAGALADTETAPHPALSDVAHEMRTPLTALDGYVEAFSTGCSRRPRRS